MLPPPFKIEWQARFDALAPLAVVAFGAARLALRDRLLSGDDELLAAWQGVYAADLLFVAGADLPWTNNVIYLGKDAAAPQIYLPTNRRPNVPLDLFEKILLRRFAEHKPFAVVENRIIPVGAMRPLARRVLQEIRSSKNFGGK